MVGSEGDEAMARAALLFEHLDRLRRRPSPFSTDTVAELWTDPHIAEQMLRFHLDGSVDRSSPRAEIIERSVSWMIERFSIGPGSRVLDLGCGPGLFSNALARTGATVTGVDFSSRSLDHAADVAADERLNATYLHGNYLELDLAEQAEQPDLITMIMRDFSVLSPPQRGQLLARIASTLHPSAAYLFDLHSAADFAAQREQVRYEPNLMDGFWSPRPYHGFLHTFVYPDQLVTLDRYTILERDGQRDFYNWLQYFSPADIEADLHDAGLSVVETLGDVTGAPFDAAAGSLAVVAQRR